MAPRLALLAATLCAASYTTASYLESHSFEPPFDELDAGGERQASAMFKTHAYTQVNRNFVRLTPDRQSKRGAVWSRRSIGGDELSTTLTFRISGQGKKFFGDGLALWIVNQGYYVEGELHGSTERFTGVGVIIDTFKNAETLSYHRDVAVIVNDGSRNTETMLDAVEGCNAGTLRFHEERGDFNAAEMSHKIKVVVTEGGKRLKLYLEDRDADEAAAAAYEASLKLGNETVATATPAPVWSECLDMAVDLPAQWLKSAHLGLSASTGQLADNHDVISLVSFSDQDAHAERELAVAGSKGFERGEGFDEARLDRVEDMLNTLLTKLDNLQHHFEHEIVQFEDHMKVTTSKLSAAEAESENRITELERRVMSSVEDNVETRLSQIEGELDSSLISRISSVERVMNKRIGTAVGEVSKGMGKWKLPFVGVLLVLFAAGVFLWRAYRQAKKSHLL